MKLEKVLLDSDYHKEACFDELMRDCKAAGLSEEQFSPDREYEENCIMICSHSGSSDYAVRNNMAFVTYNYYHKGSQCLIEGFDEITADFLNRMYERCWKLPWTIAETERLLIREFSADDHIDIFPDISTDPDFTRKYIEKMYGFFGFGIWAVILKSTGELVGRAGLSNSHGTEELELGYEIEKSCRRKGYAFEACSAIISVAGSMFGQSALTAFIDEDNKASIALAQKLGFRRDGSMGTAVQPGCARYRLEINKKLTKSDL